MRSMRDTAKRLQQALIMRGRNISLNSRQFYSIKYQKVLTCWQIREDSKLILKTYSVAAVVQELAKMYKEAQNEEAAT